MSADQGRVGGFAETLRRGLWTRRVTIEACVVPGALLVDFCGPPEQGQQVWDGTLPKFEGYTLGTSPPSEGRLRLVYLRGSLVKKKDGGVELRSPMFGPWPPSQLRADLLAHKGVVLRLFLTDPARDMYAAAIVAEDDTDETARAVVDRGWQAVLCERVTAFAMGRRGGIVAFLPLDVLELIAGRLRPAFFRE